LVRRTAAAALLMAALLLAGCAHLPNQFRETGPAVAAEWDTPTALDVRQRVAQAEPQQRAWAAMPVVLENGAVLHGPLYFEDPFEDRGHGRTEESHPRNVHRLGWEDAVAVPYSLSRFTLNWLLLPASLVVTPPWTPMISDSRLNRQALGYDHDAERLRQYELRVAESGPPAEPATEPLPVTPSSEPAAGSEPQP
jgi:hypothetical protein